jgi:hypothetical protein
MRLIQIPELKTYGLTVSLQIILVWSMIAMNPRNSIAAAPAENFAVQKMRLLKKGIFNLIIGRYCLSSPLAITPSLRCEESFWAPENCTNGIDDDGDGFIDAADPDCGCSQTILLVARDNGQILRVNLSTGGTTSVATSSPYVSGNLNAMGANADKGLVYYCSGKKVYFWNPTTNVHGMVVDLNGKIGSNESLSSGGGEYYNGYLYLGTENGNPGTSPKIWRQQLSANGLSFVGNPVNLNAPIPSNTSWGDMIATVEGGQVVIFGMTAAGTSYFWKFNTVTSAFTLIRNDLPTEMQIGVDINGNAWAGSLSSGMIQKINRSTGYFYGNIISFGGKIWDLTGPINCPQAIEICGNGIDDDNDGFTDNEDQDCLCPVITPTDAIVRSICEGETTTFTINSNAPNPPYSKIEFYRYSTPQTNPYLSTDSRVLLGSINNITGTGSISTNNFPNPAASILTYHVYGLVNPAPQFPATCAPMASYTLTVKPAADLDAGADVTVCQGTSASLIAAASNGLGPFTYSWSNGLGSGASKTVTPTSTTTYTVTVTSGNGCTTTDQVVVNVAATPSVDAGADKSICNGTSTQLVANAQSGIAPFTYNWSNGLGSGATKTVAPPFTTTYTVTVTGSNGCTGTDQVKVTVNNCVENCTNGIDDDGNGLVDCNDYACGITASSASYFSICAGANVNLSVSATGGSGVFNFVWDNGLGTGATKTVSPTSTTYYTVTVTATSGCSTTRTIQVEVLPCPENCTNGIDDDFDGLIDCLDPDCSQVGAPQLGDDFYSTCPGTTYTDRVIYNDDNLQDPVFSIITMPIQGSVTMDGTGKFTYTPNGQTCGSVSFVYQVCNSTYGCCDHATVTISMSDTNPPTMINVPADITIGCDDEVPPPGQVFAYDSCPGIYMDYLEQSGGTMGSCGTFAITRTWTATDLCNNQTVRKQKITVQDLAGPEIMRVYTLPNGKKMTSGIAQFTTQNWKYVPFPMTFPTKPIVLAQVTSENEDQAVVVQVKNVTTQGFQMKLMEQEASPGDHLAEKVSWMAIEKGTNTASGPSFEVGTISNATHSPSSVGFSAGFTTTPGFVAALQSTNETDPVSVRVQNMTSAGTQVLLMEESSKDVETTHVNETLGYLAVAANADLTDVNGELVGETGVLNLTNAWVNVPMRYKYSKPVVILGGIRMNDASPVTVRVKGVSQTTFQARLQEWTYQNGLHEVEQVTYMVVEGSVPSGIGYYCGGKATNLVPGVNLFARDNCDSQVDLGFVETVQTLGNGVETNRTWLAIDDCGKTTVISRTDTCTVAAVRIKSFLNGAFLNNQGSNLMRDDLRAADMLPVIEPYTDILTFKHKGKGGGEAILPSILDVTGDNAVVDWVFVEIRDSAYPASVLETKSALLQRDGDVVTIAGDPVLFFPSLQEGNYFVAVRHRNHLGMMSDAPLYLSSTNAPLMDFTDMKMGAKGWNEAGRLVSGKRMHWLGDLNSDRRVIYQGPNNDIFYLFSKVVADPANTANLANFISTGYDPTDLNLDGKIIFQGPNNERATLLYQAVLAHPANGSYLANFLVREFLP